jgi:hypothetical protein
LAEAVVAFDDKRFFNDREWDCDGALPDGEEDFFIFRPLFFDMMIAMICNIRMKMKILLLLTYEYDTNEEVNVVYWFRNVQKKNIKIDIDGAKNRCLIFEFILDLELINHN